MAYINVAGTGNFATIDIAYAGELSTGTVGTDIIRIAGLQDITINNSNGQFRWKQLDSTSEYAVSTTATNQVTFNMVLDPDDWHGDSGGSEAVADGVWKLSNDKTEIDIKVWYQGTSGNYITATGYITGLSPTVNPDAPVWVTPVTIDISGSFTAGS